ncbi:MAG: OmpA family protein [Candidatus Rokubacteria bacterium]|nr:OmpA family protein [Candidatus Rokubacteria bacterium]
MARRLLITLVVTMAFGCTTVRVVPPPPAAEVSGRWVGSWRAIDTMNVPREGMLGLDLAQDGASGRGKMVWFDTHITMVPESARLAGALGVPVVFAISGSTVALRHELGARQLAMQLTVDGDEIVGAVDTPARVEVRLTRLSRPGAVSVAHRLGLLEADGARVGDRVTTLEERTAMLAAAVEDARGTADEAAIAAREARDGVEESTIAQGEMTARLEELLERRASENVTGAASPVASSGHTDRTIIHTLDVRFAFDKSQLDDAGATALLEVVDLLKENPELSAELEGYTDSVGSTDYNMRLSQRRVEAVHRYLARAGVPLERVHIIGLGQLPDKDPDARTKNRRVTVKLLMAED